MLELSYNNGSTFRGCQKKFYWRYIECLDPITKLPSLTLGSVLHEAFDMFYKGSSDNECYAFINDSFREEISKQEVADQEPLLIAKYTAAGMWMYYPYKKRDYVKMESEETFSIPLTTNVSFIGRVDGRVLMGDNWWVRELKTTGLNQRQFEGRCKTSAQGSGYVYGMSKLGHDVKGLMYEYIKKPLLRKGVNENAAEFGVRIMKDYKERPKLYYARHYSYRNAVDLKHFEEDTIRLAEDIQRRLDDGRFYRNMDACYLFGSECPYSMICFADKPDPLTVQLYYKRKENKYEPGEGRESSEGESTAV